MERWTRVVALLLVGLVFASSVTVCRAAEPRTNTAVSSVAGPAVAAIHSAILSRGFLFDLFRTIRNVLRRLIHGGERPEEPNGCGCETMS
jgi:hypothetical protein